MFRNRHLLTAIFCGLLITLGCQRSPTGQPVAADKTIEVKLARTEADLKKAHEEIARLIAEVKTKEARGKDLEREIEDLKHTVKERTAERDVVAGKLDGFRKNVKELLNMMDAAMAQPFKPNPDRISILDPSVSPPINPMQ